MGWGEKIALKAIQEYGSWENVFENLHKKFDFLREKYPDLNDNFKELEKITTDSGKQKYPDLTKNLPFAGVMLAFEKGEWKPDAKFKKGLKNNLLALAFEERVRLAYSLKKMDDLIENLPEIKNEKFNREKLLEYFNYYDIKTLQDEIGILEG